MTLTEVEQKLEAQSFVDPAMIHSAFEFWYSDSEHIRSPFPVYIRDNLKIRAIYDFLKWVEAISEKARKEINDEILAEKFEEVLFEAANAMVLTEDEKLTIKYPFLPRAGDWINEKDKPVEVASSVVMDRWIIKKDDHVFLKVKMENKTTGDNWETEFELPE